MRLIFWLSRAALGQAEVVGCPVPRRVSAPASRGDGDRCAPAGRWLGPGTASGAGGGPHAPGEGQGAQPQEADGAEDRRTRTSRRDQAGSHAVRARCEAEEGSGAPVQEFWHALDITDIGVSVLPGSRCANRSSTALFISFIASDSYPFFR